MISGVYLGKERGSYICIWDDIHLYVRYTQITHAWWPNIDTVCYSFKMISIGKVKIAESDIHCPSLRRMRYSTCHLAIDGERWVG